MQNNTETKERTSKYSKGSRVLAMITLIIIVVLIIATFVCAIIGSKLYLGFLFAAIIVPCVIYAIIWLREVLNKSYGREIVSVGVKPDSASEAGETETDETVSK